MNPITRFFEWYDELSSAQSFFVFMVFMLMTVFVSLTINSILGFALLFAGVFLRISYLDREMEE